MSDTEQLAAAILASRHARDVHFDPEVATDGPFTILLTLYQVRANTGGVSMETAIAEIEDRMSIAVYALERLVSWGYIESVGSTRRQHFRLTVSGERAVERYLTECLTMRPIMQLRIASAR